MQRPRVDIMQPGKLRNRQHAPHTCNVSRLYGFTHSLLQSCFNCAYILVLNCIHMADCDMARIDSGTRAALFVESEALCLSEMKIHRTREIV